MGQWVQVVCVLQWLAMGAAFANPYPDPTQVPQDELGVLAVSNSEQRVRGSPQRIGIPVLRVQIDWTEGESYQLAGAWVEASGTPQLALAQRFVNPLGSYRAFLKDEATGESIGSDVIGTGKEYRKLVRALSFRFALPTRPAVLHLFAENPVTGEQERVLTHRLDPETDFVALPEIPHETRYLKAANLNHPIVFNIYADGYPAHRKEMFFASAVRAVETLRTYDLPLLGQMEIRAVFAPSDQRLGAPRDLGQPIPEYQSFLGLFFPYWDDFGRWSDVVYPTRESRFRAGLATEPYDYALVLVDSNDYWGVGNFRELIGIPGENRGQFEFLLIHELGHYFGLNEEYNEGGRTELEFAPEIAEPWSQNNTFLRAGATWKNLKWNAFVEPSTPLPTPANLWHLSTPVYGAYRGGYAGSAPTGHSHTPGLGCVMDRGRGFCPVCRAAIERVMRRDLGEDIREP